MTMTVAKIHDKIVEVVSTADTVAFSTERGWVLITTDVDKPQRKKQNFQWVPATTRFEWVRTFGF
jgi:hypothetical protein